MKHKNNSIIFKNENGVEQISSAFKSRIVTFRIRAVNSNPDINEFFLSKKYVIKELIEKQLEILLCFKVNMQLFAIYTKRSNEGKLITDIKSFNTKNKVISKSNDINEYIEELIQYVIKKSEEFQERDSGWALQEVLYLEINFNKYSPLKGSSYIDLPAKIKATKSVINIQNSDNMCFVWSVIASLYPTKSSVNRVSSYPHYENVLNLNNLEFPIKLNHIKIFEEMNNISINVYGLENNIVIGPLHYTNNKRTKHVNLLYIENEDTEHYCLIKDLSKLVGSQLSSHKEKKWICDGCLIYFSNKKKFEYHLSNDCNKLRTILPNITKNI